MAISGAYEGSAAISTTEYSCPNAGAYSSGNAISESGVYQVFLDVSDLVAGDQLRIRVYEKCRSGDTQRVIYEAWLIGAMAETWVSPSLILMHGWDVTLYAYSGTVTVNWSIRKVA